jgi:hypothetical protein
VIWTTDVAHSGRVIFEQDSRLMESRCTLNDMDADRAKDHSSYPPS